MNYALEISQLTKTYANGKQALKGIDLIVETGDFFALLGPNGAGKSTTIGIVSGLVNKSSGTAKIFGHDINTESYHAKSSLGVVPQEINFSQFETCHEIVLNQAGYYGLHKSLAKERAEHYLNQLGLWDRRFERSRNLSGGLKRRLMIARALTHNPKLLILDEPSAGVDVELRRSMWDFLTEINEQGTTIVLTTHYLEEAERLCRNIAIIDNGEIIQNTSMKSLLSQLTTESLILDLKQPLTKTPTLTKFDFKQIDELCCEVTINQDQDLNDVFEELSKHDIKISSVRNKSNRLEELFINLVDKTEHVK